MLVFYFFAAILIWLGVLSLRGGFRFLAYVQRELAKQGSDYAPFASVVVPCRGVDQGLRENLIALFVQDYPTYEVVFVVDDERDEAVSVIKEVSRLYENRVNSKLIAAGRAAESGQKVHNLRRAVTEVAPESEVFVFVDSDARPQAAWLKNLVAPLENEQTGAATGYRWFISRKGNVASELRSVWNASIASALGADAAKNFCWGGSTAIRRETFERIEMTERWRGTLSDDFALMRVLREHKLPIHFVPQCLTATVEDCTFADCLEFTTRQIKITRVYAPDYWKASLVGGLIFTAVFLTGILIVLFRAVNGDSFALPLVLVAIVFLLGAAKAWLRLAAVKLVLTNYRRELNWSAVWHLTLWTVTPAVYVYNGLCAAFSRKIKWRGIEYFLKSPNETVIINRDGGSLESQAKRTSLSHSEPR
jgi:ceramide glucosyltransferase